MCPRNSVKLDEKIYNTTSERHDTMSERHNYRDVLNLISYVRDYKDWNINNFIIFKDRQQYSTILNHI